MTSPSSSEEPSRLFRLMVARPLPFLLFFPILWIVFCSVGWTRDNRVEDQVYNTWTQKRSAFAKNQEYATSLGANNLGATTFLATAVSRDGKNLFTEQRLNEIRDRMKLTEETTTVSYKGETYSWDDICFKSSVGKGTVYQIPCSRLTPMDYFQESRWDFTEIDRVTWYQQIVRKVILKPRLERIGILQNVCSTLTGKSNRTECDHTIMLRNSEEYAVSNGFPPEYAQALGLFADIGGLELNNECRRCIEEEFETTISMLQKKTISIFQTLNAELEKADMTDETSSQAIKTLRTQTEYLAASIDRQDIIDFFAYSTLRELYAQFGTQSLIDNYQTLATNETLLLCRLLGQDCPDTLNTTQAAQFLLDQADNDFSSINTAGNPLPYWSEGDGTGSLFAGSKPVSGAGIDLSGEKFSTAAYLDIANYKTDNWNPLYSGNFTDPENDLMWDELVETDPVFRWFIAEVTNMTAHCGNENLTGTDTLFGEVNRATAELLGTVSARWCTPFNIPYEDDQTRTVQHFARMWYDLLVDSPGFLALTQGESDPYVWTIGEGCGYSLAGTRYSYSMQTDEHILGNASGYLYYIDEGVVVGAIDRNLLIGGATPTIDETSPDNPLQEVKLIQTIYPALLPTDIVDRVKNCNRPQGPLNITIDDAEEILFLYKEAFENSWTQGWDDESAGQVQFVGLFDDAGAIGTLGRLLSDVTLDGGLLVAISIIVIAVFSVIFLANVGDPVESRVMITLVGVGLVILAFFAAIGFGLLVGIKINIAIAWTLPFIMLGLGVDDMYIVLLALKNQKGYTREDFNEALKDVLVPISMTSMVNAGMFAIMNISDIPAVYLTAQVALISVVFLYLTIVFCFPAYCFLDFCRQADGRYDIMVCKKANSERTEPTADHWSSLIYTKLYKPLMLGSPKVRVVSHSFVWIAAATLLGMGAYGLTQAQGKIGLGLEDFFPPSYQAHRWATLRTEELASWTIQINWGSLDYGNPDTQMFMIKQFEDVVDTPNVAEIDTKFVWIADVAIWASRHCLKNFDREDPDKLMCGRDQVYEPGNSTCSATWVTNTYNLRQKVFAEKATCVPFERGICRPSSEMHALDLDDIGVPQDDPLGVWCPVLENWSDEKLKFCLGRWRAASGGIGRLVLEDEKGTPAECSGEYLNDEEVRVPIPYSSSPTMNSFGLYSHEITLDMIEETRAICDDVPKLHCWLSGAPYSYWSQYIGIFNVLLLIGGASVVVGFIVSFLFLLFKLLQENHHDRTKVVAGSLVGASLIAVTTFLSLITVSGLAILSDVSLTGFSVMSFVLSVGFAVEYSVHIVARWLRADADLTTSLDRVEYTMSFLMLPTFMSFASSTIGVACLAGTDFEFNEVFFFRPLIIVMFVTYFYGCWWLPALLTLVDFDAVKLGHLNNTVPPIKEVDGDEGAGSSSQKESVDAISSQSDKLDAQVETEGVVSSFPDKKEEEDRPIASTSDRGMEEDEH